MSLREASIATPEVTINYAEGRPNGPPFVVLHGGSARWQHGEHLLAALEDDWHVLAPDFRGHGKSGHVPAAYLLQDFVRDTAAFLSGAVRAPAIVYGHSLGGEVAVMLAARHPDLVRALIVGDAPLSTRQHATDDPHHRAQNELWLGLAGHPPHEIEAALRAMPVLRPGEAVPRPAEEVLGRDSEYFGLQSLALHQLDPEMLAAVLAGPEVMLVGYDPAVLLQAITCPVLLLQADPLRGGVLRDDEVELGLELLACATHVRLDGIGHSLHGPPEQTPRVVEAMMPFLSQVRAL
jgi:pimeloyl-ACP methyl ester carboxylesterase